MKNKAQELFFKYKIHFFLLLIFLLGAYLRIYHFNDFLHFELDQSRDAKVIDLALEEGVENLPLLGPKAAGSFLRLGPIFYYFEYLSAKIFGATPPGMVGISLVFSCFTIIVLYFFLKDYFGKKRSLFLTLLFSTSLFFVMYSHFGWNPNNIPFFSLVAFLALRKISYPDEKRKGIWLLVFAVALSIVTQLHFLAFMAVPTIAVIYLIVKRPKIKIGYWLASIAIVLFFYFPVILNDIKTGGDNIKEFQKAFSKKSTDEHTLIEKAVRDYSENSLGYFLLISSREKAEVPKFKQLSLTSFDITCDASCRENLPFGAMALIFFTSGAGILIFKNFQQFKKRPTHQKDFLLLNLIWFVVSLGLFFPVAYDIAPRFFLLIGALPFVFLGLIFQFFEDLMKNKKITAVLIGIIVLLLLLSNSLSVYKRFQELTNAPYQSFEIDPDRILKEKNRVTLKQQYLIVDYMEKVYAENAYPTYINSDAYFRRSFLYHLQKRNIPQDDFRNVKTIYREGNYFLIYPTLSNLSSKTGKYMNDFDVFETKQFGTLVVFRLIPREASINADRQVFKPKGKPQSAPGVPVRYRWEEIFSETENEEELE